MKPYFEVVAYDTEEMILRDMDTDDRWFVKIMEIHHSRQGDRMRHTDIIKRLNQITEEVNTICDKIEAEDRIITEEETKRIVELGRESRKWMEELWKNPLVV